MTGLLFAIVKILGGILLGITTLDKSDGTSNFFNKIAKILVPFETVIGGALVVFAILTFRGSILQNVLSILGGVLLLTDVFGKVPAL